MASRSKIRVGVLRGGPSQEHAVSIKTGAHVLKNLPENCVPVDIYIDKAGVWHVGGVAMPLSKVLRKVDVIFNATHGAFGEDGKLQKILDTFGMPYSGSGHLASILAMHKGHSKKFLKDHGIKSPYHKILNKDWSDKQTLHELWRTIPNPSVVKPVGLGSSLGVTLVKNFTELESALTKAFTVSDTILVEEYIAGREATCGVIDSFRGEEAYSLLPVELVLPVDAKFFDYDAKYAGKSKAIHPGRFSAIEKHEIQTMARRIHKALGLRHYSRSDFIVSPTRGVYFLEVNTLPALTADSPYVESLSEVGLTTSQFLDHVLKLAVSKK